MPANEYTKFLSRSKKDTFVTRYFRYMENQETPHAYDFWSAMWLVSCALGRRVVVPRPNAPVHMNLFTILVAESAITRKSTSVKKAEDIAARLYERTNDPTALVTTKMTPEAFVQRLHSVSAKHSVSSASICISELVTFLGREKYLTHMPGLLTDLYDCPDRRNSFGTLAHGSVDLRNVYVNLLSASTPTWLAQSVNPNVVEGGFTSRCLFICASRRKKFIAWSEKETPSATPLLEELVEMHQRSHSINAITLSDGALRLFRNWYQRRQVHRDPFRSSFEGREDGHVLRLAALLSVNREAWQIQQDDIENALAIIKEVKEDGARVFDESTALLSDTELLIDKLRSRLISAGSAGLFERDLLANWGHLAPRPLIRTLLHVMHELGFVEKFETKSSLSNKKPLVYYIAKRDLLDKRAFAEIAEKFIPS